MDEREFIKTWFYSDLNIQFEIKKGKKKGILTLESNASYYNGKRYGGDKRLWVYNDDYEDYDLYDKIKNVINFDVLLDIEDVFNDLEALRSNGFKVILL